MKRVILFLFVAVFLFSCSRNGKNDLNIEVEFTSVSEDNLLSIWEINKNNCRLENCQELYNSIMMRFRNETKAPSTLTATHKAILIRPKSFSQQMSIENDTTLVFSYTPFGQIPKSADYASEDCSLEEPFEVVDDSDYCVLDDDALAKRLQKVSDLYVIWPVNKQIPEEIDYELCFELFDPYCSNLPEAIKGEMARELFGLRDIPGFPEIQNARLTLKMYDQTLSQYVPLKNIAVKADYGSIIKTFYTNSNGVVIIPSKYGTGASVSYRLTQDHFSVRDSVSSAIVERSLGLVMTSDPLVSGYIDYNFSIPEKFYETVYQAADFFFNENSDCASGFSNMSAIPIYGMPSDGSNVRGYYVPASCYIVIYDINQNYRRRVIGTTIHELAHHYQYCNKTGISAYYLSSFFKESFATCCGNHLGELYYTSKGYIISSPSVDFVSQARQYWDPSNPSNYSPIFVDLIDDYNQHSYSSIYVDDIISGVQFAVILEIGRDANNYTDIRTILITELSGQYTSTQIDYQLSYYINLI